MQLNSERMQLLKKVQASEVLRLTKILLGRRVFREFIDYTKPDYIFALHHELMISKIHDVLDGKIRFLFFGVPPRHGKSEIASVRLPAFHLGIAPFKQITHISYASSLSNDFSRQVRSLVRDSELYHDLFPHIALDPERARIDDWKIRRYGGGFLSVGTGGGVTGHGSDLMIIDDPHKEGDWQSPKTLDDAFTWYSTAARTRLSPGAPVIFPMTRWSRRDLAGQLLALMAVDPYADQWVDIVLPAIAEANDILGRKPGEALWPERFDEQALLSIKALDDRQFQALFQNNPLGSDEILFRRDDFIEVSDHDEYLETLSTIHSGDWFWSFDLASSEKEAGDYTVFAHWLYDALAKKLYVADIHRVRMEFPEIRKEIISLMGLHPDDKFCFPKHLLELLMMQELKREVDGSRIIAVDQPGDKKERANVLANIVRQKRLVVLKDTKDAELFIVEHCDFPDGQHDDCVDCSSVATHHLGLQSEFTLSIMKFEKPLPAREEVGSLWS